MVILVVEAGSRSGGGWALGVREEFCYTDCRCEGFGKCWLRFGGGGGEVSDCLETISILFEKPFDSVRELFVRRPSP